MERECADLLDDIWFEILGRLGTRELFQARQVCRAWRSFCNEAARWRRIVMEEDDLFLLDDEDLALQLMTEEAIDRSRGGCIEFTMRGFGHLGLVQYLSQR